MKWIPGGRKLIYIYGCHSQMHKWRYVTCENHWWITSIVTKNMLFMISLTLCYTCLPISLRITSLALGQSYDCPSASEVILKDMGKAKSQWWALIVSLKLTWISCQTNNQVASDYPDVLVFSLKLTWSCSTNIQAVSDCPGMPGHSCESLPTTIMVPESPHDQASLCVYTALTPSTDVLL